MTTIVDTTGLKYDNGYYDWQTKRIGFLIDLYGKEFFVGKKILELGCFKGGISILLQNLITSSGSLTSVEGLKENYDDCVKTYPSLRFIHGDEDFPETDTWAYDDHYDIIVHWGLLYHLQHPIASIQRCLKHCDKLFLETLIIDSTEPIKLVYEKNEWGTDQSIHNIGTRCNTEYVENIFKHLSFKRYDDSRLNSGGQPHYDWTPTNSGEIFRRFWIIDVKK